MLCLLGFAVLFAFAPASRNITPGPASEVRIDAPVVATLAALSPVDREPDSDGSVIAIEREWDTEASDPPAIISWWDDERWTALENEQARWRAEWLREARRNPENVPLELWPQIAGWAPYDRTIERSARAALGSNAALRRYASQIRNPRGSDWDRRDVTRDDRTRLSDRDVGDRLRRWARDALRDLQERASDRTRRARRSRNESRNDS